MLRQGPRVFVSYRREDSRAWAGRLGDLLRARLGRRRVFLDVASIGPGTDFPQAIDAALASCDVVVALIGPRWLAGERGRQRLAEPGDFVAVELRAALAQGLPVIPVLVDGAALPDPGELPAELAPLCRRQAIALHDDSWDADAERLLAALAELPRRRAAAPRRRWLAAALAAAALVALVCGFAWHARGRPQTSPVAPERPTAAAPRGGSSPLSGPRPVLAVIPFANRSGDRGLDRYAEDLAGRVGRELAGSWSVQVRSPDSLGPVLTAARSGESLASVAAADGIDYLVSGELRPGGLALAAAVTPTRGGPGARAELYGLTPATLPDKAEAVIALARRGMGLPPAERVGLWTADFPTERPAAYEHAIAGLRALNDQRYADARSAFTAALQIAPGYAMARYRLAWAHALVGETGEALALIARVRAAPALGERERLYAAAAEAYFRRDYPRAETAYRELLRRSPREIEPRLHLAQILSDANRLEEALQVWRDLAELEPGAGLGMGRTLLLLGRGEEAHSLLMKLVRETPGDAESHALLGDALEARGELTAAQREYRAALALAPERVDLVAKLAEAAALEGRTAEAISRLAELASDSRSDIVSRADAGFELADLLRAGGRFREAARVLADLDEEIAEEQVREALALAVRGLCAMETGDAAAARRLTARAIARAPAGNPPTRYLFARGLLELRLGDLAAVRGTAAAVRRRALPPASGDLTEEKAASYLEGLALLAEGHALPAVSLLARAVDLSGYEYDVYRLGLARALLAAGRLGEARAAAERSARRADLAEPRFDLDLGRNRALLVLAEVELAAGRPRQAAAAARRFVKLWPRPDPGLPEMARAREIAGRS